MLVIGESHLVSNDSGAMRMKSSDFNARKIISGLLRLKVA